MSKKAEDEDAAMLLAVAETAQSAAWTRGRALGTVDGVKRGQKLVKDAAARLYLLERDKEADFLRHLALSEFGHLITDAETAQADTDKREEPREKALYEALGHDEGNDDG